MKLLFAFFLISSQILCAQSQLSGIVLNADDNKPLPSASVFINNTGKGTLAGTESEGFDVHEKIRVDKNDSAWSQLCCNRMYATATIDTNTYVIVPGPKDMFTNDPKYIDLISKKPFPLSKACLHDSSTNQVAFYIANRLQIVYKYGFAKLEYLEQRVPHFNPKTLQQSGIHLATENAIVIQSNGNYFDPLNVISEGYWGWCKMAETLPSDYISH